MPRVLILAPVNQVFVQNMRWLWRYDVRLAQKIDDLPLDASLELTLTKAGPNSARVRTADGRMLQLHSRYDPQSEADEFCEGVEKGDAVAFVLAGLGLGYHVKSLFRECGDQIVVIVTEPDLVTIKTALEQTDLSAELASGRLVFISGPQKPLLHDRLGRHSTMLMLGTVFVVPPTAREHNSDFHGLCRKAITDFAAFARMSLVTLVKNSAITCRNIANNLPTYITSPPADVLRQRFEGCPAILVAAGPSLAKNIGDLCPLQDRAVIIAAQTTLRPLLERGIRPHFVTSLDYSNLSRQFFEDVDLPDDLVLVAEPKASCEVVDTFRGATGAGGRRVIMMDNDFAHRCLGEGMAKRTPMEAGATVMHLAFYLAKWLGCDPIIFIGQDLAFSGHTYYAPGVAMHRAWTPELGRFVSLEMKEWERIARQRPILRKTTDLEGRSIYTDDQMFTYLQQFERDFATCAARVVDATEGGARKCGAQLMSLREAGEQFCGAPIAAGRFEFLNRVWYARERLGPARDVLAGRREELETFESICRETRELLVELGGLLNDSVRFNDRLVRVDELRTMVQEHENIFRMVGSVSQLGELQKFSADRRLKKEGATGQARARRQLQRDRRFVDALLEGCSELRGILDNSLARFDGAMERSP